MEERMTEFKRGLQPKPEPGLIKLLNDAYDKGGWWRDILNDKDLHIGLRNDYLNVYYQGNSLCLIKKGPEGLLGQTHYKYLLHPGKNLKPIISADGTIKNLKEVLILKLDEKNLKLVKKASSVYAGDEKKGIQWILNSNPNIIDMEIAFTKEAAKQEAEVMEDVEEAKRPTAPRLDFAALQQNAGGVELVFFEAKLFSNKELRATGEQDSKVVRQIGEYEKLIEKYMGDIKKSYIRICDNFSELKGISDEKKNIVRNVLKEGASFTVSPHPRLVIFGFDQDQRMGGVFEIHLEKLKRKLGEDRVLVKGDPKKFTSGISF
jgi:hypothetical protein